jgi:hypothetical protein
MGTYLVHSTLLIGGLWLAWRLAPTRSAAVRAGSWRLVLLAGLVTSLAQVVLWPTAGWQFTVATIPDAIADTSRVETPPAIFAPPNPYLTMSERATAQFLHGPFVLATDLRPTPTAAAGSTPVVAVPGTRLSPAWGWCLVGVSVVSVLGGIVGWARHWLAFRTLQADCVPVTEGRAWDLLERLRQTLPGAPEIDLVTTDEACEPAAWALPRPTILLPERAERELDDATLQALLAHELAHLARQDAAWLQVARLACACLSIQPLNHLARREWQRAAECLGDDWAIERTGDPLALARCLTTVAGWRTAPSPPLAMLAALGTRSDLTHRVERLLERPAMRETASRTGWRVVSSWVPLAAGLAGVMLAPGLSLSPAPDESTPVAAIHSPTSESLAERRPTVRFPETFVPPSSFAAVELPVGGDWPGQDGVGLLAEPPALRRINSVVWTVVERIVVPAVGSVWQRTVVMTSSEGEVEWVQTTTAVWTSPSPALSPEFPGIDRRAL